MKYALLMMLAVLTACVNSPQLAEHPHDSSVVIAPGQPGYEPTLGDIGTCSIRAQGGDYSFGDCMDRLKGIPVQPKPQPQAPINCTTSYYGNQAYTTCY